MNTESAPVPRRMVVFALGSLFWGGILVVAVLAWRNRDTASPGPQDQPVAGARTGAGSTASTIAKGGSEPAWNPGGIDDFSLTERSGRTVTKADLLGHPWIVSFIFTHCAGPCPMVTSQMYHLQRQLKDTDVRLVTITVDPKRDTVEVLRKYADQFQADPERWWFLTGDQTDIYRLIADSFQMPVKEITGPDRTPGWEIMHTTNILLVDAAGRVQGKYGATNGESLAKLRRALNVKDAPDDATKLIPPAAPEEADHSQSPAGDIENGIR